MKILVLLFALVSSMAFATEKVAAKIYGKMEPQAAAVATLSDVTQNFDKYKGQNLSMIGTVKKVCVMSGCWFELSQGEKTVRITMKDYGFTVPKDILNKNVKVVGVMESKILPVKMVKHYMKDEGRPQADIEKVTEPQNTFEFVANGVALM